MTTESQSEPAPEDGPYTDRGFHAHFRVIRDRLRKFDTVGLVGMCLTWLHAPAKEHLDYLRRHPWLVLLLVKWALLDERAFKRGRPAPSEAQATELLRLMFDLGEKGGVRLPSQYDHIRLFFRTIGYQQFIYQQGATHTAIARQQLYFGSIPAHDYIRTTFLELTGIDIPRFLDLAQGLLLHFGDGRKTRISAAWFGSLGKAYADEEISSFLKALSKSMSELRAALLARDAYGVSKGRLPRSPAEYWEQTPFVSYPLLKTGPSYVCWDRHILFRCIEHYVYSRLRDHNAQRFMTHFGPLFESYVEKAIVHMGQPFVPESALKAAYGEQSVAIDFIIAEEYANVFVDAKGVEMSYQGKTTHESAELAKWLQTSALKAIKQAHGVMAKLPYGAADGALMRRRKKNYLIVVTYSELYVGDGRTLAEAVRRAKLEPLMAALPAEERIPLENMYFMTIRDFELLAEAVRSGQRGLTSLLDHAAAEGADPITRKVDFGSYLATAGIRVAEPDYLVSRSVADLEALAARIKS